VARQTNDYLLRQTRAIAAMLARIAGFRIAGEAEEARAELDQAYGALLGPQTDLVRRLDASTAAAIINSPDRMLLMARLLEEERALSGDEALHTRAIALVREALQREPDDEDAKALLLELTAR
jgi:hypothetical protein